LAIIIAERLVAHLEQSGFVVMRKPAIIQARGLPLIRSLTISAEAFEARAAVRTGTLG